MRDKQKKGANFRILRARSHYRRFCRKLLTLRTKICRHTCFPMRPLICDYSKISKSEKKHQTRRQSCQHLKRMTPNVDGKVTKLKKEREISSLTLTFSLRAVRSYSMDKRDFPFPYYGHQMPRRDQYFFPQDLDNTPQFGLLRVPNKENRRVTVTLFDGRMASVVTEHNFTAKISLV